MKKSIAFWICLITSIILFVGGFLVPPMGVIDGSVLKAVGMLLGFGALGQAQVLIKEFEHTKFTKGDMTIEVERKKKRQDD